MTAFFDLDRTLIDVNSALLWAKHERAQGKISRWQMLRAAVWGGLYHLSMVDVEKAFGEALWHYQHEPAAELEARTCVMLAGMVLARIDGKSPVEYITDDADKARVRGFARRFLLHPATQLNAMRDAWQKEWFA